MSALAHLGANGKSPKQKPTLSRHQNAIAVKAGGDPYPATGSVVSLFIWGSEDCMHQLTYPVTNFKSTRRTHGGETPETQGRHIGLFIPEGSHLVKFNSSLLPITLKL